MGNSRVSEDTLSLPSASRLAYAIRKHWRGHGIEVDVEVRNEKFGLDTIFVVRSNIAQLLSLV